MQTGTSHFVSLRKAVAYYRDYGFDAAGVQQKIDAGEIHIGPPSLTEGQRLEVIDHGARYAINDDDERTRILDALARWIGQRPGLDPREYGHGMDGWRGYLRESRSITRDLHDARQLLSSVRWREHSISAAELKAAFREAYSGRLSWDGNELHYCTGQYWPTEFRRAACAVLASALWHAARADMPKDAEADHLRKGFRKEYGARMQRRWFN
jgi:alkylhydroperoxidase family enzyme